MRPIIRRPLRPRFDALEGRALLSGSGTLDPTFASGQGSAYLSIASSIAPSPLPSQAEAVQANGQIVVVANGPTTTGAAGATFLVTRFNANGTLDTTFGTNGKVVLPFNNQATPTAVAIESNGQIVVGGVLATASLTPYTSQQFDFVAARLNANGSVDTHFGIAGGIAFPVGGLVENVSYPLLGPSLKLSGVFNVNAVLVQADGSIVLAGNAPYPGSTVVVYAAARLTASGVLDTGYGGTGIVYVPVYGTQNVAAGATLQSNGDVVIAGTSTSIYGSPIDGATLTSNFATVIRLTTTGTLDPTFGGSGEPGVAFPYNLTGIDGSSVQHVINVMTLLSNDDIILGGDTTAVFRLHADGTVDTTFGVNGEGFYPNPFTSFVSPQPESVAVDHQGNIVIGFLPQSNLTGSSLIRFTPAGAVDTTFGSPSTPGLSTFLPLTGTYNGIPLSSNGTSSPGSAGESLAIAAGGNLVVERLSVLDMFNPGLGTVVSRSFSIVVGQVLSGSTTSTPVLQQPVASYDGSGKSNLAVYVPALGTFFYRPTTGGPDVAVAFGAPGTGATLPAPGDYSGVGHTQIAAYLTGPGDFAIRDSTIGQDQIVQFGSAGAGNSIPVQADYYGTGQTDLAVYLTASGTFAIQDPTGKTAGKLVQFGAAGIGQSIPAPADYYGTGQADIAVYLAQAGAFAIQDPTGQTAGRYIPFGMPGLGNSIPVPGDYDCSGHVELAVYIPSQGAFYYRPFSGGADVKVLVGVPGVGDIPAVGDYDGVGHDEFAIYDPTSGFFEYAPSNGGAYVITYFGAAHAGSIPVTAPSGSLAVFSGSGIKGSAIVPSSSPSSPVPAGTTLTSVRVARSLINQATSDPFRPS